MGKKTVTKHAAAGKEFWDSHGWRPVDVGDDLLLGADEYGFCGLEELDGTQLGGLVAAAAPDIADTPQESTPAEDQAKQGRKQKGKKRKQPEAGGDELAAVVAAPVEAGQADELERVKQELAELKADYKQLAKKQKKDARAEKKAAAAAKRDEARAAKQAAAAQAAAQAAPRVDVSAWRPLQLHPSVEGALAALGFEAPTHVQAECLPAAIRDRRDVIGAAQTGSGKTLAFGLPIMQLLLEERQQEEERQQQGAPDAPPAQREQAVSGLRALVLAPTRELALQVCQHLQAVGRACGVWVVPIVGGISALKQERLLAKQPQVVVATPGRLWDLMREGHAHVTNLSRLSFLVIDEADRMVQQGHYGELNSILGAIPVHQAAAVPEAPEPEEEPGQRGGNADEDEGGEARQEEEGGGQAEGREEEAEGEEEEEEEEAEGEDEKEAGEQDEEAPMLAQQTRQEGPRPRLRRHRLQTFVFSATLTLPANLRKRLRKGGGGASGSSDLDSLMDRIPFSGKPKIVDLTSERKLADKVEEAYLACGEAQRDEYLYCLLAKHPGRTIVFVNAISSVRRLAAILKLLGLPAQPLHAGMQQRQRLKALDRFRAEPNAVLVATDVAARGLDVKDVRCVVHYQLPASADVYVHRAGRTARAEAEGLSVALVTPKENARFLALLRALRRGEPPEFPLDLSLMPEVHRRVRLAVRLDELERKQGKARAEAAWRRQHAEQLGLELSGSEEDEDAAEGRRLGRKARRDRGGKRGPEDAETAGELRGQLAALLAEPLQPRFSRKWFTGGAAAAVMAAVDPSAPVAAGKKQKRGKREGSRAAADDDDAAQQLDGGAAAAAQEPSTAQTVHRAVALAQQRADTRSTAAAAAAAKQRGRRQGPARGDQPQQEQQQEQQPGGGKKLKKQGKKGGDPRAAALQAALRKALAAKQRKKAGGRGMLVIPQALGRDAAGPDALQALRQKLGKL